jgi:hypothetical protein
LWDIALNYSNREFRTVSQFLFATFSQFQPLTISRAPSGGLHLYRTRLPAMSWIIWSEGLLRRNRCTARQKTVGSPLRSDNPAPPIEVKTMPSPPDRLPRICLPSSPSGCWAGFFIGVFDFHGSLRTLRLAICIFQQSGLFAENFLKKKF